MNYTMSKTTRLIDATLREGFQAPNALFSFEDVTMIASQIAESGADMIEVGHPYVSEDAMKHTRSVVQMGLGIPVLAHARAFQKDIKAVFESGADWVGIFIGVNEISERTRLGGRSFSEILEIISDAVHYAKSLGLGVRFTVEDSSRTEWDRMTQAFSVASDAGAERICFADSVGIMEPHAVKDIVTRILKHYSSMELEVHFHDDRGLAVANALAAIDAGAHWISVSVNGLGERCGITDHAVLAANLTFRDSRPLSKSQALVLAQVSKSVSACSQQEISKSHPVLGEYAFTHTARLHVLAIEKDHRSYEWIDPARLGRKHGTAAIKHETGAEYESIKETVQNVGE